MPASAGTLNIAITATDKATAQIEAINKQLAAMRAPAERMQKALVRFGEVSGLNRVVSGFRNLARSSLDAFRSLARIVEPFAAITGAASLAGMYRLVSAWGAWGSRLGFTAQRIGIGATQLQSWQGAAQLAGTSAQGLTSGLQNLGQTMYDAVGGRNPAAVMMLNQLGVAFKKDATHARSVTEVLPELADKIAGLKDPYAQAQAASVFFGGATEDMLPFLRRGAAGIAELTDKAIRYGVMNQGAIDAANRMREANTSLKLAVEGLGNSISEKLSPVLSPLLTQMADWIAANRDWIATGIGEKVQQFATWVQQIDFARVERDAEALWHTADNVAQALGGWRPVLEGLFALMAAKWALTFVTPFVTAGAAVARLTTGLLTMKSAAEKAMAAERAATAGGGSLRGGAANLIGPGMLAWQVYQDWQNGNLQTNLTPDLLQQAPGLRSQMTPEQQFQVDSRPEAPDWWRDHVNRPVRQFFGLEGESSPRRLPSAEQKVAADQALAYFQSQGWTKAQAAGIVANISKESGFNRGVSGDSGHAFGLAQWHEDRQAQFAKQFGHSIQQATYQEQLQFINWELRNTESKAGMRLAGAQTAEQAGAAVSRFYERPAAADAEAYQRGALAQQFMASGPEAKPSASGRALQATMDRLRASLDQSQPAVMASGPEAKLEQPAAGSVSTVRGSADLNITVNAPPGTKTTATTKGDLFNTPRIASGLTTAFAGP